MSSSIFSLADYLKLAEVIYRRTGIKLEDKRYPILQPKFEKLFRQYGYQNFRAFFHDFRFGKKEGLTQEVMNLITINETYFFREKYQFETLIREVLPQIHQRAPAQEIIRILCAPSSTGEEPYSIVLSILQEGQLIQQRDFEIVGIDIDSTAIEKAKAGVYSERSVKFVPDDLFQQYFQPLGRNFILAEEIRNAVNFQVVNVMDKNAFRKLGRFDVIFCRNMLIYFDDHSRKEVVMNFYEQLKPKGVVFLGHAESMSRIVSVFRTVRTAESIYYQKP